ncbi:hypothetical protein NMG60_11027733 [Bertholletia excelsa]
MDKNHYALSLTLSLITALGVASFALCMASEFKRTKRRDLKWDGDLCYLPGSRAFGLGIGGLFCLFLAQAIGNSIICRNLCSGKERSGQSKAGKPTIVTIFLLLSWSSFGIAAVLIMAATSMNRKQLYGEGWLDGDCYIVKDGVYAGASILVLVTVGSTLASAITTTRKGQTEQVGKIHAQIC